MHLRSGLAIGWALFFALLCGAGTAQSQTGDYPSQQIELVVPFPAGGATDVITRLVAQRVSAALGQTVVVQNKAGATGAIGSEYVARATPDGYTLLVATASTHAVLPAYRRDLPYDTVSGFSPVTLLCTFPNLLVVNPKNVPANNVADFIAYLKANPAKLNFASSGAGGSVHFAGELFKLMTKTEMQHVPYRGSAPALTDLLAGSVDLTFDNMTTVWPAVQQGQLRALGVASPQRTPLAPEVPAISETVPGFEATSWVGVVGPAEMPAEIGEKLRAVFSQAINAPDIVKRLAELGATPATNSRAEFRSFIEKDRARWRALAAEANIRGN